MNPLFNLYGFHDQISRGRKGLTILTREWMKCFGGDWES